MTTTISKISVKIILAALFLLCLFKMPYGYFQLVRFLGMASFIWFAYLDNEKNDKSLVILWVCSAILINPLIKIALGRTIWNIVDVVWALILLITLVKDFSTSSFTTARYIVPVAYYRPIAQAAVPVSYYSWKSRFFLRMQV